MRLSSGLPCGIDEALEEQRHHVERRPADVDLAGGIGVAHLDRVVDQHQLDLELLAVGRLPFLAGLEAVVGQDDRRPAGPDVEGEPDGVVLSSGLYAAVPLTGGSFSAGLKLYSLTVVGLAVSADSAACSSPTSLGSIRLSAPPAPAGPAPSCGWPLGGDQSLR